MKFQNSTTATLFFGVSGKLNNGKEFSGCGKVEPNNTYDFDVHNGVPGSMTARIVTIDDTALIAGDLSDADTIAVKLTVNGKDV